jgi:hypothetical protein
VIRIQPDEAIYLKVNNKVREGVMRGGEGVSGLVRAVGVGEGVGGVCDCCSVVFFVCVRLMDEKQQQNDTHAHTAKRPPKLATKVPGLGLRLDTSRLDLQYRSAFAGALGGELPDAYERLLLDVVQVRAMRLLCCVVF